MRAKTQGIQSVEHISLISMFADAGPMVKFVMLLLLAFSGLSWFIIFKKYLLFRQVAHASEDFLESFWKSKNLAEAYNFALEIKVSPEASIFLQGYNELQKLSKIKSSQHRGEETFEAKLAGLDNLKRALQKAEQVQMYSLGKSLSFLATTGSATPFIGLFGTVWGIMNSFRDIGKIGSASLAVVAPGISEALVATAAGLAVAIPAVIFYNFYSNKLSDVESNVQTFANDFLNLVERDLIAKI